VSLLSVVGLAKAYGGVPALRDASLTLEAGEAHALIGENGAGKSTLIRILAGVTQPDAGAIAIDGRPVVIPTAREAHRFGLRFLHQELNVLPRLSVAENLFLGRGYPRRFGAFVDWRRLKARAAEALAAFGVTDIAPDAIVGRLRVGDRLVVKIASTFLEDATAPGRIFVTDEPTAALNERESERLFRVIGELKRRGAAVIYVSHRIEEILSVCDRVTVLRDGVSQAPVATAGLDRASLIERMTGRSEALARAPSPPARSRVALELHRLSGDGLSDISLALREGEILGLAGLGGAGGDRLLRAIMGASTSGAIALAGKPVRFRGPADAWASGLAYVPRERRAEGLLLKHDIAANVSLPHLKTMSRLGIWLDRAAERRAATDFGKRVRLRATGSRQRASRLSGGNQQKVLFARAVAGAPRVLLLDEPTRGVDIGAKYEIHALLREMAAEGAAILVSSSDYEELVALCSRIAILIDGRLSEIVSTQGLTSRRLLEICYGGPAT
jgi:ABC-type sugar transport system ATPase subunit